MTHGDRLSFSKLESLESRRLFAAGDVDTTFGTNGLVTQTHEHGGTTINDMAALAGNQFLIAGLIPTNSHHLDDYRDYFLQRYNSDGTLDPTFGDNGTAAGNFIIQSGITNIEITPDNKIAAIVYETNGNKATEYHLLARFNSDGSVDTTFGNNGFVKITSDKHDREGNFALSVQSDGKMVVGWENAVRRYNTDGTLDSTFGTNGEVDNVFGSTSNSESLRALTTGKIVVGGVGAYVPQPGVNPFAIVTELNSDGSLNTSFGGNGVSTIAGGLSDAGDMIETGDGKILLGGGGGLAAARLDANGQLDSTFGNSGVQVVPNSTNAARILLDDQGQIYLIGNLGEATRFDANGTPDAAFGDVIVDPASPDLFGSRYGAAVLTDGRLILGGQGFAQSFDSAFVVLGRLTADDGKPSPVTLSGRSVSVAGTSGDDFVDLRESNGFVTAALNGFGREFQVSAIDVVNATGGDGNDQFDATDMASIPVSISGGNGHDRITGGAVSDTLNGNGGRDFIDGGNGADHISGGGGNDQLRGQGGADIVHGGPGNDYLEGNGGNDQLDGGAGNDVVHGDAGDDLITANDGAIDTLFGDGGTDTAIVDADDMLTSIESTM